MTFQPFILSPAASVPSDEICRRIVKQDEMPGFKSITTMSTSEYTTQGFKVGHNDADQLAAPLSFQVGHDNADR